MVAVLKNPTGPPHHSLDEYFALVHASDERFEYWQGEIVCMSGGSYAHGRAIGNAITEMFFQLKGGECFGLTEGTAVRNPFHAQEGQPPFVYPDASIVCGQAQIENVRGIDTLMNPILVLEVISATSADRDHNDKLRLYTAIPTLRHYLLVASEEMRVVHWEKSESGEWTESVLTSADAEISIVQPSLNIAVRELYTGVL